MPASIKFDILSIKEKSVNTGKLTLPNPRQCNKIDFKRGEKGEEGGGQFIKIKLSIFPLYLILSLILYCLYTVREYLFY